MEQELALLRRRRAAHVPRWDAAYRVLHAELGEAKARMAEYVAAHSQGGGGGEAVRVP